MNNKEILISYIESKLCSLKVKPEKKVNLDAPYVHLSNVSKMPCASWSTPTEFCPLGKILSEIPPGTSCSKCYAKGFRYRSDNAQYVRYRNFLYFLINPSRWAEIMVMKIQENCQTHFRWFDSGDLYNVTMLEKICDIALALPEVKFWLPTQQADFVKKVSRKREIPQNLCIRISSKKIGIPASSDCTSYVYSAKNSNHYPTPDTKICPAPTQGNKCKLCRACWDKNTKTVAYKLH